MYIKEISKKNKGFDKKFFYARLVQSYRIGNKVRHKNILNLGKLELHKSKWKDLSDRIEQIINKEDVLFETDPIVERLANHYAALIVKQNIQPDQKQSEIEKNNNDFQKVDIGSLETSQVRTLGAEYVSHSIYKEIEIDKIFKELGFTEKQRKIGALLILGRLIDPGSENAALHWAKKISSIGEFIGYDFKNASLNSLYRTSDLLYENKEKIESLLKIKEKNLYSLKETILIYDLTNTYFEGRGKKHSGLKYGRSKEKRSDCLLLTLGIVIDENGFPKKSEIFPGNISEPKTLENILNSLNPDEKLFKPLILIDAGISSEENLNLITDKGYDYVCVPKGKPKYNKEEIDEKDFILIKENKTNKIEVKVCVENENEKVLICKSRLKELKEESMQNKLTERFEKTLENIKASLSKSRGIKKYEKVIERIGRAKERHKRVSYLYDIQVKKNDKAMVEEIKWELKKSKNQRVNGQYYIKTNKITLSEKEIWDIYNMIRGVEDSFRSLKNDLGFRPNYHQKKNRINGHVFISVLSYHILNVIRFKLKEKGYTFNWSKLRKSLSTHVNVTTSMKTEDNRVLYIRKASTPELFHQEIYNLLELPINFTKKKTFSLKM